MKPKRSVEHVVTDLFAFLGTYDYRDERRILALDAKEPEAFRTFYSSYLPLIVTLWTQALQYNQPKHADAVSRAFIDELTARLYRLGAAKLAEDILHGVAGLPKLLQRENGVVLVAAACVESMTGGNIPKKGKRANLLTQKILKILQFFITKLSMFDVVDVSPVRAPYVSMFFASTNGNGVRSEPPAMPQNAPRKSAQSPPAETKHAAAPQPAATNTAAPLPDAPPAHVSAPDSLEERPVRNELPPEPLTSDEPPLEEIEEVWAKQEVAEESGRPALEPARSSLEESDEYETVPVEPKLELETGRTSTPDSTPDGIAMDDGESMAALPEDMGDSFYDDGDDDMAVVEAEEPDDIILDDDEWPDPVAEDEEIGAGDPYNELGMDDAGGDSDFSGFEFEETADDEKFDRGIDVDEFHDVINQVVTEVLAAQDAEKNPGSRGA
ncbi:hypothetical protein DPQ33_04040 [Oceanidesulfovibrio indonesiensis]|uniref:Uncharacterized protein n=1 Tax=Oceanidesulfovibrio indonesiensis TaxID=54767 RepID=A0A7M3MHD8_9BACT|nr:hypothetical protein [Oceanidesulfovibrio indonesiensis]TVM18660.1 hypothetical protein DPQ33_04040 [Oceanidesulfovibrio indonesiensis]